MTPPSKRAAYAAVQKAIKDGRLVRSSTCEKCGNTKHLQAHHNDYSKPLEVEWLCRSCHTKHHNETATPESSDVCLNVWVPPELGKQLDEARGLIPMQRYVVHVLEQEMERLKEGK